ncbi:MAG TPA: SLBB domain-containing protein [Acidobacteriaceae bacterium]|nr:SLBB domain-containing protein [Acidobacteriaceae bacterium]
MRQQLVFSLSLFFAVFSPLAIAQNSPSGEYPSGTQATPAVDCTDPLLANSTECQTGSQSNNSTQYGQQPSTPQINPSAPSIPQPGMNYPQTYNDLGNRNNQLSRYSNAPGEKPLPPQPLTEFQKFVAGTTGQVLPVFGANLFQNAPSTFAPVDESPVPPDYVIGPGDVLRIRIWGQVNFNANVIVDRAGEIYLPQVGEVHVAGLPYQVLSQHLHDAVARVFRNFNLTADIGQTRALQVYVVGQAHRPGTYTISSLSTLVDALFASGGPSIQGSMRNIYLKRDGKTVADFDLYDLLVNGDKSKDAKLQSGDVIYIPPVGPQVALTGAVGRPAIYELRDNETTVADLLKYAGGPSATASSDRISIERIENRQERSAMEIAFDQQGLATTLRQGDILRIFSIVPAYQKTVTLRGYVANPGRFAWHPGMRLSDLIPDRDSLLSRDYWWKRAQLGLPTPEFEPVPVLAAQSQPSYPVDLRSREENFPLTAAQCRAYNAAYDSNWYHCNPYGNNGAPNPDRAGTNGQPNQYNYNQYNQAPYDQFPGSTNWPGTEEQQQNPANPQAGGGTLAAGQNQVVTENTAGATQHTRVALPAPEIDWDYAVIERLNKNTLKTSLIPFDLGKLVMDHDPSQNLELQPGDIVSIFSQADIHVPINQQTKFVRLEGEFVHAGVYSVKPGETLPELVARAGGFSPNAYLYGSEFTRAATRAIQQQRINEYVQNLQLEINRGTLAQSSSAISSAQDIASANAAAVSERQLISKLQQIRATGRIVLEEKPHSTGIAALPAIQLEDGDSFVVPPEPASVNVVGAVYDQNSFLFVPGRRVGDYLHLAGGPNRDADSKHAFIIRADGSVLSRAAASGVWGNTFASVRINPGDTIVVPEKTYGPSAMRAFLEWSQLFSQLALGAAAVSIIQ